MLAVRHNQIWICDGSNRLVQVIEMLGRRVFYVQASDSDYTSEDHLEVEKGRIDWTNLLKALDKQGFDGFFGIDIGGSPKIRHDLDGVYLRSRDYLVQMIVKHTD